jgi:hypothetical protein
MKTTYEKIRPFLQTGDSVFFRGKGFVSDFIAFFCKWSHYGKIIRRGDRVLLLEATTLVYGKHNDNPTPYSSRFKGVRLLPFSKVLKEYNGRIGIRRLSMIRTGYYDTLAEDFIKREIGKPYERHAIELVSCQIDNVDWYKKIDNADRFCLELGAAFDMNWKILSSYTPANEYSFADYLEGGYVDEHLMFNFGNDVKYLPMEMIK